MKYLLIAFSLLLCTAPAARAQDAIFLPPLIYFDLDGKSYDLHFDTPGQITFIHFWATWCAPCIRELPTLNAFAKTADPKRARFIVIAVDSDPAKVSGFFRRHNIDALTPYIDTMGNGLRLWGVTAMPTTVMANSSGEEAYRFMGDYDWRTFNWKTFRAARLPRVL